MKLKQYHSYLDKDFACIGLVDTIFSYGSSRITLIHVMLYKLSLHGNRVPFDICRAIFFLACYLRSYYCAAILLMLLVY